MKVKIGTMTITYIATDATRHKTRCNFTITIEGKKSLFPHYMSTHTFIIIYISNITNDNV